MIYASEKVSSTYRKVNYINPSQSHRIEIDVSNAFEASIEFAPNSQTCHPALRASFVDFHAYKKKGTTTAESEAIPFT